MKNTKALVLLICLVGMAYACGHDPLLTSRVMHGGEDHSTMKTPDLDDSLLDKSLNVQVKAFFEQNCMSCHRVQAPSLTDSHGLRSYRSRYGKVIDTEKPAQSILYRVLVSKANHDNAPQMPPMGPAPTVRASAAVLEWIEQGADFVEAQDAGAKEEEAFSEVLENVRTGYQELAEPVLKERCFACHNSAYDPQPIYRHWPLVSQIIDDHREKAQQYLELSEGFPFKGLDSVEANLGMLGAIATSIEHNTMPPPVYRNLPWYKGVQPDERLRLQDWIDSAKAELIPFRSMSVDDL